jgi:hypothetical protein
MVVVDTADYRIYAVADRKTKAAAAADLFASALI